MNALLEVRHATRRFAGLVAVNDVSFTLAPGEILGIVWAIPGAGSATPQGWAFAYGIAELKARFAADGIDLICESSATLDDKRVAQVGAAPPPAPTDAPVIARQLENDLSDSQLGRALTGFWLRHSVELNRLVNRNRRVATRWHRSGGAALFQYGVRSAYHPSIPIPAEIGGRSTDECLREVLDLFDQYGSHALRDDIRTYRGLLPPISGRSYVELLGALRGAPETEATWRH